MEKEFRISLYSDTYPTDRVPDMVGTWWGWICRDTGIRSDYMTGSKQEMLDHAARVAKEYDRVLVVEDLIEGYERTHLKKVV